MAAPIQAPMPENLELQANYTLRVAALDPTTGGAVSGVNVGVMVITADAADLSTGGGIVYGDWFLVPGPGA